VARSCNCAGGACGCTITVGDGLTISGIGTAQSPFLIEVGDIAINQKIDFNDSENVFWTVSGGGETADPLQVEALAVGVLMPTGTVTHSSGNLDLTAYEAGGVVSVTMNGDIAALDLPTVPGSRGTFIILRLIQGTGPPNVVTSWGSILWAGGTDPTLSTTGSDVDIIRLTSFGSGWYGVVEALDIS